MHEPERSLELRAVRNPISPAEIRNLGAAYWWVVAVATVFLVRRTARADANRSDVPDLNVRAQQYVGRVFRVEEPIVGGRGKVRVGDTLWPAQGPDAPKGASVKVTGTNGTVLVVELAAAAAQ